MVQYILEDNAKTEMELERIEKLKEKSTTVKFTGLQQPDTIINTMFDNLMYA